MSWRVGNGGMDLSFPFFFFRIESMGTRIGEMDRALSTALCVVKCNVFTSACEVRNEEAINKLEESIYLYENYLFPSESIPRILRESKLFYPIKMRCKMILFFFGQFYFRAPRIAMKLRDDIFIADIVFSPSPSSIPLDLIPP